MKWLKFNKASGYDLIPIDDVIYVKGTDAADDQGTLTPAFVMIVHMAAGPTSGKLIANKVIASGFADGEGADELQDAVNAAIVSTLKKGADYAEAEDVILPVGKVVTSAAPAEYTIT